MTASLPAPGRILPANPFATRFTQPGMLAPCDADGFPIDTAAVAAGLPSAAAALAIIAPHGHGKTTLLLALLQEASALGRPVALRRIGSWGDACRLLGAVALGQRGGIIGIDGWDAVPGALRLAVRVLAGLRRQTLLVTAHSPCGLPELARLRTSSRLLAALVDRLPPHGGVIGPDDVAEAYANHSGNIRDALFDLYDRFERQIR
ncbi:MAG: hypothetical protein ACKOC8_02730 [Pirellulales bacterium]